MARGVIIGRTTAEMNLAQAEHAFDEMKERGVITQPPAADGDAWVLN